MSLSEIQRFTLENLHTTNVEFLDEVTSKAPKEITLELAENFFNFYLKHDKVEPFLKWAVKKEVFTSKSYGELFREESFSVRVLQRMMYTDLNIKFLRSLLGTLLKELYSLDKDILFSNVDDPKVCEVVKSILKYLNAFLQLFRKSLESFPPILRDLFTYVHESVQEKYPDEKGPFVVSFIFFYFICPVLINPKKYDVVKNSPKSNSALIYASKILNDLALGSIERQRHANVVEFISQKREDLVETVLQLISLRNQKLSKRNSFTEEDRRIASFRVLRVLEEFFDTRKEVIPIESLESPETFALKLKKFEAKVNHPGWKKVREKDNVTLYSLKDDDVDVIAVKLVTTVEASPDVINATLDDTKNSKELDPNLDVMQVLKKSENYEERYFQHKLPFPFANRDVAVSVYFMKLSPYHRVNVADNLPTSICPKRIGFVRSIIYIGGYEIKSSEEHPNRSLFVNILHASAGGSIPAWFTNLVSLGETKRMVTLRKFAEEKQKKLSIK